MALRPDLVDLSRRSVPPALGDRFAAGVLFDEVSPKPNKALGELIIASQIARLGEIQGGLLTAYTPRSDWQAPSSEDVEDIWGRFERLTRKYWSTNYTEYKSGKAVDFLGWEAVGER